MATNKAKASKNKPVHEIRMGAIKAVIWANPLSGGGVMHNVLPVRVYRDEQGAWHETHSLHRDDLLVAAKVLDQAHSWVVEAERK